jgi:hypothetical protein
MKKILDRGSGIVDCGWKILERSVLMERGLQSAADAAAVDDRRCACEAHEPRQSQRDCVTKPRVGTVCLPWVVRAFPNLRFTPVQTTPNLRPAAAAAGLWPGSADTRQSQRDCVPEPGVGTVCLPRVGERPAASNPNGVVSGVDGDGSLAPDAAGGGVGEVGMGCGGAWGDVGMGCGGTGGHVGMGWHGIGGHAGMGGGGTEDHAGMGCGGVFVDARTTQGSPAMRDNPGLCYATPLGLAQNRALHEGDFISWCDGLDTSRKIVSGPRQVRRVP